MTLLMTLALILVTNLHSERNEDTGSIHLEVLNIKNSNGQIGALLFSTEDGYPDKFEKALWSTFVPIENHSAHINIEDIPYGEYVLTVMHDENNNGKMDKKMFGKPKEGYGVSNNPEPRKFGPPKYDEAIIKLVEKKLDVQIQIRYND